MTRTRESITREHVLGALRAKLAKGRTDPEAIADALGATTKAVKLHLHRMRAAGLIAYETANWSTLAIVGEAPKRASKPAPKPVRTVAEVAERHATPPPAAAAGERWTAAEMRELLDVPRRAVSLVRRALATPWGLALLDAIDSLVEESEAVPPVEYRHDHPGCCSPDRAAEAAAAPVVRRDPKPGKSRVRKPAEPEPELGPVGATRSSRRDARVYEFLDADGDVVGKAMTTKAEAMSSFEDDDEIDQVREMATGRIIARKGVDDEDEEAEEVA